MQNKKITIQRMIPYWELKNENFSSLVWLETINSMRNELKAMNLDYREFSTRIYRTYNHTAIFVEMIR